jgi:uncharacterized cupredoxin-like copper-binding protein
MPSIRSLNAVWSRSRFTVALAVSALALLALLALSAGALGEVPAASAQQVQPVEIQVILGDATIRTSAASVPAGVPVRFVTRNGGTVSHQLALTAPNARGAILAPGETHTVELVFGAPATIQLFCPIGDVPLLPGVSHRQKGMEATFQVTEPPAGVTIQATPAIAPAPQIAALTAPDATVDRVGLPEAYQDRLSTFYVFDRSDNRQVRHIYGNRQAFAARDGQPFPYGSILVMETWRAKLGPDNQIALDASGRYQKDELAGVFVMRKEPGFGTKYGPDRTGEWEYVAYRPDGMGFQTAPERSQACAQCHKASSDAHKDWVVRANIFFTNPPATLPSLLRLPQTGHGPFGGVSAPPAVLPFAFAAAAPLVTLVGAALKRARASRNRSRRNGGQSLL